MNQSAVFRFLIVASIVLEVLGSSLDAFMPGLLPEELDNAYEAFADVPTLGVALAMGVCALVLLVGAIAGAVGLFLFKRWGRALSFWLTVLSIVSYPFLGPVVYSGWAIMLTEIGMMLWGAALAMAYFSELKLRFEGEGARVLAG